MSERDSRVVKIKPFPIDVKVMLSGVEAKGQIQKMNLQACLIAMDSAQLKVQDRVEMTFELPVHKRTVHCQGSVVKVYLGSQSALGKDLVEVQFRQMTPEVQKDLHNFFSAIGGVPR